VLRGRCALVTGATQGIGAAIADQLASAGANLVVHGIEPGQTGAQIARELEARHGIRTSYVQDDLSDEAAAADLVRRATDSLAAPDILVNNAGIQFTSPIDEFPVERWNAIIAINLSAAFHTMKAGGPVNA
jgi:3-hydroxybutyrate dehydrogenase